MNYSEYLESEVWQRTRRWALDKAGDKCQLCKSDIKLNVHHNDYSRLGKEEPSDIIVLCEHCHKKFHGKKSEPLELKVENPEASKLIKRLTENPSEDETLLILGEIDQLNKKKFNH